MGNYHFGSVVRLAYRNATFATLSRNADWITADTRICWWSFSGNDHAESKSIDSGEGTRYNAQMVPLRHAIPNEEFVSLLNLRTEDQVRPGFADKVEQESLGTRVATIYA